MKTITLEVENEGQEELILRYHSYVMEMEQLALTAPMEEVIDQCEEVAVRKGADINRETLQRAVLLACHGLCVLTLTMPNGTECHSVPG